MTSTNIIAQFSHEKNFVSKRNLNFETCSPLFNECMRYAAAYLLAILGGNLSPDVNAIVKILGSVGIECDEDRAKQVVNACHGRSIEDIIASGLTKIDNMSTVNETVVSPATTVSAAVQQNAPVETNEPQSDPSTPDDDTFIGLFD